jgi:hypothetical protein
MSKMDGLRAMREARYAENAARAKTAAPTAKKPAAAKPAATKRTVAKPAGAEAPATKPDGVESAEPALCGHRNMSGRSCTREQGHAAKSHRYS